MAEPITWRNINSDTVSGGAALFRGAQRSLDSGFQTLNNVLQQYQQTQQNNWTQQRANNTADYLDAVANLRTPEAVAAAQQEGGLLAQLRSQFGRQVDANAVRGAADARTTALQQQALDTIKYNDAQAEVNSRPLVDQFWQDMYAGRGRQATALLDNNVIPNEAELRRGLFGYEGDMLNRRYAANQDARAGAQLALSQAANARAEEDQGWARTRFNQQQEERQREISLNTAGVQAVAQAQQQEQEHWKLLNQIGRDIGIPMDEKGNMNLNAATPFQRVALNQRRKERGLQDLPSPTARVQQFLQQALDPRSGFKLDQVQRMTDAVASQIGQEQTLLPKDQANFNKFTAPELRRHETEVEKLKRDYDRLVASNGFAQQVWDPEATAADLTSFMRDPEKFDPVGLNSTEREQLASAVLAAVGQGVRVKSSNETIPITPAMAQLALNQVADNGWGVGDDFTEVVEKMVNAKGFFERYQKGLNAHDQYAKAVTEENRLHISNMAGRRTQFRKDIGLSPSDVNELYDVLDREQNTGRSAAPTSRRNSFLDQQIQQFRNRDQQ